ncbi:methyltransferase domain-containing protein [Syntrophus buswellii]|uniref:methyltransferase domain-containing protein n=1 Tax=Syntrophus TaxID=43773 RepID=UPI00345E1C65
MAIRACRVCGRELFRGPLLRYENMPKAAQNFPAAADLADETGLDLEVCQCMGCGLVQLSGEPVPYYREVIRAAAVSEAIKKEKARQFADFIGKHSLRGKKMIEIGCGRGEFLSLLSALEVQAYGLEFSETSVAECLKAGLHVARGYPGGCTGLLENGPFDAFLLLMFLEHMPDPNAALRTLYDNLTDQAVGLVEVPNFDMVLKNGLFSEFIGDHLLYFTRETLQSTLQLNGFEWTGCEELRNDYVLSAVVKKRPPLDITYFHRHQEKITAEVMTYLKPFAAKRVAVWGAGHQALALIALTGIAGSIRYVVDSAPFKQGRYTPATHLPVVAPEALFEDPVDAVLVIAGSYSDEVAWKIRQECNLKMPVAVLRGDGLERV